MVGRVGFVRPHRIHRLLILAEREVEKVSLKGCVEFDLWRTPQCKLRPADRTDRNTVDVLGRYDEIRLVLEAVSKRVCCEVTFQSNHYTIGCQAERFGERALARQVIRFKSTGIPAAFSSFAKLTCQPPALSISWYTTPLMSVGTSTPLCKIQTLSRPSLL